MNNERQIVPPAASRTEPDPSRRASPRLDPVPAEPSILVVVANYGTANDVYLHRLLAEFRSMRLRLDLHVLTDVPKTLGSDVTLHVGLPNRNPRSLPFNHRRLFAEYITRADYFIYCEDDTLVTERNIRAFLEVTPVMNPGEIPGFLRLEHVSSEERYMESAHGPYRWDSSSFVRRGSWAFASFTNLHSAFNMASRAQVQKAIDSGGFLVEPHVGHAGMLECAACDIYTQCGLKRLICISRFEDFVVSHLSNKNCLKWGLKYEEFLEQTRAFLSNSLNHGWKGSLFEVETRMPRRIWSKNLYERPDPAVLEMLPNNATSILSVGCGWGATEEFLAKQGKRVVGLPVDAVFADCLRRRRIELVEGPIAEAVRHLNSQQFDVVLMQDVLQLVENPIAWLTLLKPLVSPSGHIVATVPRTYDPLRAIWYFRGEPESAFPDKFARSGVQRVTRSRLDAWFDAAGLDADIQATCNTPTRIGMHMKTGGLGDELLADRFILRARPRAIA